MSMSVCFSFFIAILILIDTSYTIQFRRKSSIVTPIGSNNLPDSPNSPNYMSWPVPFFTDNQFGFISTIAPAAPITYSPPSQASSTSATRIPPATIGRVNTIISSPAPTEVVRSNVVTSLAPLVTLINPSMMVNHSVDNPNIIKSPAPKQNRDGVGPAVTVINPVMMINYSIDNPNIIRNPMPKQKAGIEPLITYFDPKYLINYSSTTSSIVSSISSSSTETSANSTLSTTTTIPSSIVTLSITPTTVSTSASSVVTTGSTVLPTVTAPSMLTTTTATLVTTAINNNSTVLTTPTPFTSRPIPINRNTTILTPVVAIQNIVPTSNPSKVVVPVVNMPMNVFPSNFQVDIPTVVKLDVNITQMPNYIISISPINNNDSDVVEIYSADSSNIVSSQLVTASNRLDISDPNLNIGPGPVPSPTTTVMPNRISQEKCNEYYSTSRRSVRKAQVQVFIIGGQSSSQKEFPHMAALGYGVKNENNNNWLCGGSLISELYVVTAAHCLFEKSLGPVTFVRLGTTTLQTETLNSEDYNVVRRIANPNYGEGKQYNDIALLELDRPVIFTEYIAPICLYTSSNVAGANLIATGWGKTSDSGDAAKDLQKVRLNYVPNNVCQQAYSIVPKEELAFGIMESTQICAGTNDGARDTCQGDSGGPLQMEQDGRMYLVGITSFGIGCGTPMIPGVYTRVSNYVPWIEQIVWRR